MSIVAVLVLQQRLGQAQQLRDTYGSQVPVFVATQDLAAGHFVADQDVDVQHWPEGLVPAGASLLTPAGTMLRYPVSQGSAFVSLSGSMGPLGLEPNELAVTVPRLDTSPPLEPGSTVLVVRVQAVGGDLSQDPTAKAKIITSAQVLETSESGVTLAVASADALSVVESMANGAVELLVTP